MANYTRKALLGALISYVFFSLSSIVALAIRMLLSRELPLEHFGLFYAVFAFVFMFSFFRNLGLSEAQVKFIPRFLHQKNFGRVKGIVYFVLSGHALTGTIIFLLLAVLAPTLAVHYFKSPLAVDILFLVAMFFLLEGIIETISFALNATHRIFLQTSIQFCHLTLVFLISFFLLDRGFGIHAPGFAYVLSPLILFPIYFTILRKKVFPWFSKERISITYTHIKEYLSYSLPIVPGTASFDILFYRLIVVILTPFSGLHQVALYDAAYASSKLVQMIYQPIRNVLFPISSELWEKERKDKLSKGIELLLRYAFIVSLPIAGVLLTFPDELLTALFTQDFTAATVALRILAFGMFLMSCGGIFQVMLLGLGKSKLATRVIYIAGILNVLLSLFLIPAFGIVGAAIALLVSTTVMVIVGARYLARFVELRVPWASLFRTFLASIVFLGIILGIKSLLELWIWFELGITLIVAGLVYLTLLFLLKVLTVHELKDLWQKFFHKGEN